MHEHFDDSSPRKQGKCNYHALDMGHQSSGERSVEIRKDGDGRRTVEAEKIMMLSEQSRAESAATAQSGHFRCIPY